MGIEFKARVLIELGAELISSDAVAIYELVKNSVDAGSRVVRIEFNIAIQHSAYRQLTEQLRRTEKDNFDGGHFLEEVNQRVEVDAQEHIRAVFYKTLGRPQTLAEASLALDEAYLAGNSIIFSDSGHGMDLEMLQKGYLTIGTPMRLLQKGMLTGPVWSNNTPAQAVTLGEKGIGRLAAMRLGRYVLVETGTDSEQEQNWYRLELDWRPIFADPSLDSSALNYKPEVGPAKERVGQHGTTITIRALQSDWTEPKLAQLGAQELAKLADPFESDFIQDFLTLKLQGERVLLPEFENSKLKFADAVCKARFQQVDSWNEHDPLDRIELSIEVEYTHFKSAKRVWHLRSEHLASCIREPVGRRKPVKAGEYQADFDAIIAALPRLGPFEMQFHWFNRGRLMRENSQLWTDIQPFVRTWSGGLLVYRDGFRVHPYGSATDDWLDLDRSALSGSAYKLNRAQIIGYLRISQRGNPSLLDQTNREGFRDCPEKEALRRLLRHILITKCKIFLEDTLKENKANSPEPIETLEERVDQSEGKAVSQLQLLQQRVPQETESISEILFQIGEIRAAWERTKSTIKEQEGELEQYIHLASVGLQVEFIAHELSRVTGDALRALEDKDILNRESTRRGLESQLKTLDRRIRVLDLLSIPGRQRKSVVDLNTLADLLREIHQAKIERHGLNFIVIKSRNPFKVRVEQGQILQILDNLFANSFYWLQQRFDRSNAPSMQIEINAERSAILFSDNGPGIPADMAADIFKPFVTTKPPGEGRGLGLFISRRLAEYNEATLDLASVGGDGIHRSFILSFSNTKRS